jgi:hypothetical protein
MENGATAFNCIVLQETVGGMIKLLNRRVAICKSPHVFLGCLDRRGLDGRAIEHTPKRREMRTNFRSRTSGKTFLRRHREASVVSSAG